MYLLTSPVVLSTVLTVRMTATATSFSVPSLAKTAGGGSEDGYASVTVDGIITSAVRGTLVVCSDSKSSEAVLGVLGKDMRAFETDMRVVECAKNLLVKAASAQYKLLALGLSKPVHQPLDRTTLEVFPCSIEPRHKCTAVLMCELMRPVVV